MERTKRKKFKTWSQLKVHNGFNKEYNRFFSHISKEWVLFQEKKKRPNVYCIGFSLGAALATHCGAHLKLRFDIEPNVLVRPHLELVEKSFKKIIDLIKNSTRIMLEKDPVPQIQNLFKGIINMWGNVFCLFTMI